MTGQIHDMVLHNLNIYSLCGIRGNGLFDPADHGMQRSEMSAACQRGYHCLYSVEGGVLLLQHVKIGHDLCRKCEPGKTPPPRLFGVLPFPLGLSLSLVLLAWYVGRLVRNRSAAARERAEYLGQVDDKASWSLFRALVDAAAARPRPIP